AAPPGPAPRRPIDLLLDGAATRFTAGYEAGVPALRRALQAFRPEALRSEDDILRSLWLAWLLAGDLWGDEAGEEVAPRGRPVGRRGVVRAGHSRGQARSRDRSAHPPSARP